MADLSARSLPDTFPRRFCCSMRRERPAHPATPREGPRHLADLDVAQVADECARSPAASPRRASSAACISRSSATTGRACTGRWSPRRRWAASPVPMYQDAPAAEFVYVLNDAEIALRDRRGPGAGRQDARGDAAGRRRSQHIYYDDPRGLRNYEGVTSFERLQRDRPRVRPRASRDSTTAKSPRAVPATCRSCSTRRGRPASPRACARRIARSSRPRDGGCEFDQLTADDSILSYLPMAWVGDHLFSYAQWMVRGLHDQLSRVGRHGDDRPARDRPDVLFRAAARVREPADAGDDPDGGRVRRSSAGCSDYFTGVARALRRRDPRRQAGRRVADRLLYALGNVAHLRAAAQRARHEPHPRRATRRAPRSVPISSASTARSAST